MDSGEFSWSVVVIVVVVIVDSVGICSHGHISRRRGVEVGGYDEITTDRLLRAVVTD